MNIVMDSFRDINLKENIELAIIVVYNKPTDFNNKYVGRLFNTDVPTPYIVLKNDLDELFDAIPNNFIKMSRSELDDPVIECVFVGVI